MTASILVVDDMPEMQRVLNCSLASAGYLVATAGSGEEALARIGEQEFDLIVTDIVMPGLSGLEVLEKSQLLNPRAAVIVMTGYATLETAVTALRRGACDYLEKPLHLDELNLRVRRALESREAIWRARLQQRALLRPPTVDTLVGESHAMRATPSSAPCSSASSGTRCWCSTCMHRPMPCPSPRCRSRHRGRGCSCGDRSPRTCIWNRIPRGFLHAGIRSATGRSSQLRPPPLTRPRWTRPGARARPPR